MSNKYDNLIKQSAEKYLPDYDWRLYKSQLRAESNFDPDAKSSVGALGVAQFMPETWNDVSLDLGFSEDIKPTDAPSAIEAGAYYMQKMVNGWTAPRPPMDRYCLALASYNAGFGNILQAQRVAHGANDYATIINSLYNVTGHHAEETTSYVERILRYYNQYVTSV